MLEQVRHDGVGIGAGGTGALRLCRHATTCPDRAGFSRTARPVTILISIDAFRPDYMDRGDTPVLDALAQQGVRATMRPSFPTLTFPNHTTLVTGQRPDRNGIVANTMYDPKRPGVRFYSKEMESSDPFWWAESEPLWITAEKAGVHAGTMFWPGEEAAHGDVRPFDWIRFDPNFTSAQRVRTVTDWMRRPADIRPGFVAIYSRRCRQGAATSSDRQPRKHATRCG